MRQACAFLCWLALPCPAVSGRKQTRAPEDVPRPVAGDPGPAGGPRPGIARYLNVRAAAACATPEAR